MATNATKNPTKASTSKAAQAAPVAAARKSSKAANATKDAAAEEKPASRASRRGVAQAEVTVNDTPKQNTRKSTKADDNNNAPRSTNSRTANMTDEQKENFLQGKREAAARFKERKQLEKDGKAIPARLALRVSRKDEEAAETPKGKNAPAPQKAVANRSKAAAKPEPAKGKAKPAPAKAAGAQGNSRAKTKK